MSRRSYNGKPLDGTVQWISERPAALGDGDGETVDATPDDDGEVSVEGVDEVVGDERPDTTGQTRLDDWGWSA